MKFSQRPTAAAAPPSHVGARVGGRGGPASAHHRPFRRRLPSGGRHPAGRHTGGVSETSGHLRAVPLLAVVPRRVMPQCACR